MKTKEELNEMKDKAKKEEKPEGKGGVMLTDEELEQVTGGTVYDAKCSNCGKNMGGNEFTEAAATKKIARYNQMGCCFCGMKDSMFMVSWSSFEEMLGS